MNDDDATINELKAKMAQATHSMSAVAKTGTGHHGKYATLNDVLVTVQTALDSVGLVISQPIVSDGQSCQVTNMITDISTGVSLSYGGPAFPLKADPQAAGSAITYYRRYGLVSLFGIKAEDDDGAQAHRADATPTNRTPAETKVRELVKAMSKQDRTTFQTDFMEHFGSTLTNMAESSHGEALTWAFDWVYNNEEKSNED